MCDLVCNELCKFWYVFLNINEVKYWCLRFIEKGVKVEIFENKCYFLYCKVLKVMRILWSGKFLVVLE